MYVKTPYCWKSHVTAHFCMSRVNQLLKLLVIANNALNYLVVTSFNEYNQNRLNNQETSVIQVTTLFPPLWLLPVPSGANQIEVRKRTKIRNRYNLAPHLTQDTNGKVITSQLDITNESQF